MKKLTPEQIHVAYGLGKDAYLNQITKSAAINRLRDEYDFNNASASDYVRNLDCMLRGQGYHRTLNLYATGYFLDRIIDDFGEQCYLSALSAIEKHLDYYDDLGHGKQVKIRQLLSSRRAQLDEISLFPNEVANESTLEEGAVSQVTVNAYERNLQARAKCIEFHGHKCCVCGFDFEDQYGDIGKRFIHVHHLRELSTIRRSYVVDPINDLRPVCPNCHAMLHKRKNPAFTIEELKEILCNRECERAGCTERVIA